MITENEFRLGCSCPVKVVHSRSGLARADTDDAFSALMRGENAKVQALAQALFPDAVPIRDATADAWKKTQAALSAGGIVMGAVLTGKSAQCRADFIEMEGLVVRIYTIVPKATDLERHRFGLEFAHHSGQVRREWREHFERIAFRISVAQELFPEHQIVPLIITPITRVPCAVEGMHKHFPEENGRLKIGNPLTGGEAFRLLRTVCVEKELAPMVSRVASRIELLDSLLASVPKPDLGYHCKKCEFRVPGKESGYDRCWGPLAHVEPHMFDLAYMYFVQDENGAPVANRLAREGRVNMHDIPDALIKGDYAGRQRMQIEGTTTGREIIRSELADSMATVEYPLHFLDIETIRSLVPVHRGSQVNELTLFQLSVHSRTTPDGELVHREWLNTAPSNPNRRFLAALRQAIGDQGTVCVWTRYEEMSFRELIAELVACGVDGEDFDWLRNFLVSDRLLDLNALCFEHYFHPLMRGRTSIKSVLPAVWSVDSPLKMMAPYRRFPAEPYSHLKSVGAVADGCAAMEAYLELQGQDFHPTAAEQLLKYCEVDTIAMAYVWDYWTWRLGQQTCGLSVHLTKGGVQ